VAGTRANRRHASQDCRRQKATIKAEGRAPTLDMNMAQYENTPDRFAAPYPSARMSEQVSGFVTAVYINELDEASAADS
jgi:hypothetical protein